MSAARRYGHGVHQRLICGCAKTDRVKGYPILSGKLGLLEGLLLRRVAGRLAVILAAGPVDPGIRFSIREQNHHQRGPRVGARGREFGSPDEQRLGDVRPPTGVRDTDRVLDLLKVLGQLVVQRPSVIVENQTCLVSRDGEILKLIADLPKSPTMQQPEWAGQ